MLAVRSNERAAAAVGINVRNVKLAAFGICSFIAGVAGAMYAYNFGSISAIRFSALTALGLIAFAYVGGITMVSGAIIAGLIATEAPLPARLGRLVRPLGHLDAPHRRRRPDLHPDLLPGGHRRQRATRRSS